MVQMKWVAGALLVLVLIAGPACGTDSGPRGTVFEDLNSNGIMDGGEHGVSEVVVSNGVAVTVTDEAGVFQLADDGGGLVFVTMPAGWEPTTPWYQSAEQREWSFGLAPSAERAASEFCLVQMTDIHLDSVPGHLTSFEQAVEEINEIAPAFVVATGDLVNGGDTVGVSQAREWFAAYSAAAAGLDMPLFNTLGNHDVVGIHSEEASEAEAGYGEETYREYFGPTYYSFDWGAYHCLALDPNDIVDGQEVFRISDQQLEWLRQDLACREGWPLMVFFHEPTPCWEDRTEALSLLGQHEASLFSGHWHQELLLDSLGMPEQVTGALCGEWWYGPCPDGSPEGYRIIHVGADGTSSFYKAAGVERQINIIAPDEVADGKVTVSAQIYTEYGPLRDVRYRVDGGEAVTMSVEEGEYWSAAEAVWAAGQSRQGYHTLTVEAEDTLGSFNTEIEVRVSGDETVPIGDLMSHFEAHQGRYTSVTGEVKLAVVGEPYGGEGSGAVLVSDDTGTVVVLVAECGSPPAPTLEYGDKVTVTAVPVEHSWDFLASGEDPGLIQQFASFLPEGAVVEDDEGAKYVRIMRLASGDGVQVLSR